MRIEDVQQCGKELYALAAALNAKTKEAQAQGLNVAMFVHDALAGPAVVVNVSVDPAKLTLCQKTPPEAIKGLGTP